MQGAAAASCAHAPAAPSNFAPEKKRHMYTHQSADLLMQRCSTRAMLSHKFAAWARGALMSVNGIRDGVAGTETEIVLVVGGARHVEALADAIHNFVGGAAWPALVEDLVACLSRSGNFADAA